MAERDYKVVYKSRTRPPASYDEGCYHGGGGGGGDDDDYYQSPRRSQRYYYYEDDYRRSDDYRGGGGGRGGVARYEDDYRRRPASPPPLPPSREVVIDRRSDYDVHAGGFIDRGYRDRDRERHLAVAVSRPRQSTRSEYDFLSDRESLGSGNVIVLDHRDYRDYRAKDGGGGEGGGSLTEWEIVRPERGEDGVLVIDAGERRGGAGGRYEIVTAGSHRARSVGRRRSLVDAMQDVRVTEEVDDVDGVDDDDRRSVYSRAAAGGDRRGRLLEVVPAEAPIAPRRLPSAFRHDHSPISDTRRRSRSIGFRKSQISHHDVTESRHERPGAEAVIAGRYLIDHRGERVHDGDRDVARDRSRRRRKHPRRHGDSGSEDYEYEKREREDRYYDKDVINERFDERSRPYSPQRAPSPERERERELEERSRHRRHRRHRRRREVNEVENSQEEDDKRSVYSERYTKTRKVYD